MIRTNRLLRRIRVWTVVFIASLVLSGATAIPLETELNWLVKFTNADQAVKTADTLDRPVWAVWLVRVRDALAESNLRHPFLAYGSDWLAFGHFVIAVAFIGAWRDPVRNRWLFDFGLIACVLVIPYALIFGGLRGVPLGWRFIDCAFGVFGAIPMWICRRDAFELQQSAK